MGCGVNCQRQALPRPRLRSVVIRSLVGRVEQARELHRQMGGIEISDRGSYLPMHLSHLRGGGLTWRRNRDCGGFGELAFESIFGPLESGHTEGFGDFLRHPIAGGYG